MLASGVTPEAFGAGTNTSFLSRFTNGLYGNFDKVNQFDKTLRDLRTRQLITPGADAATMAANAATTRTQDNEALKQAEAQTALICATVGESSPQCRAWREKTNNMRTLGSSTNATVVNVGATPTNPTVSTPVIRQPTPGNLVMLNAASTMPGAYRLNLGY
jgi:hypothetical protein